MIDESTEHFEVGLREANADLTAVEDWIAQSRMYAAARPSDATP